MTIFPDSILMLLRRDSRFCDNTAGGTVFGVIKETDSRRNI